MPMEYDQVALFDDSLHLNDEVVIESDFGQSLDWIANKFSDIATCPFCNNDLLILNHQDSKKRIVEIDYDERYASLRICLHCNYWQWIYEDPNSENEYGCPDHYAHAGISKIREYEKSLPLGCYEAISSSYQKKS